MNSFFDVTNRLKNLIWSHLHAIWKTLKWESSASTLHTFFCEYNSSYFFAIRVLWSRRKLFCDYNIVKAMEPPTTTYTDFPWHRSLSCWKSSKNKDLQSAKIKSHDFLEYTYESSTHKNQSIVSSCTRCHLVKNLT